MRTEQSADHQPTSPYEELAAAICGQAAADYRNARAVGASADAAQAEARRFFQGNAVELLCGGNGPEILAMLDKEPVTIAPLAGVAHASERLKEAALAALREAAECLASAEAALGPDAPQRLKAASLRLSGLLSTLKKTKTPRP
jgi:hypothetical protein